MPIGCDGRGLLYDTIWGRRSGPQVQPITIDGGIVDIGVQFVGGLHRPALVPRPIEPDRHGHTHATIGRPFHQGDLSSGSLKRDFHNLLPTFFKAGVCVEQVYGDAYNAGMQTGHQKQYCWHLCSAKAILLTEEAIVHKPVKFTIQFDISLSILDLDISREQFGHNPYPFRLATF